MSVEPVPESTLELLDRQLDHPVNVTTFEGREGETFTLVDGDHSVSLELISVQKKVSHDEENAPGRGMVVFRSENDNYIPDRIYELECSQGTRVAVYLAPSAPDDPAETGHQYVVATFS